MTKRRNLSSMQSTIADPESKLALENERMNNLLERPNFTPASYQGIVLYANNIAVDAKGTLATAVRIRVEGLTDRSIPDPVTAGREACSGTNRFINQCLEAHPIAYPRKSQTGATNFDDLYFTPSQGDIVEVFVDINGAYTYGGKIGTSPIHASMIYNFDASSQNKRGTTGAAQAAMNNGVKSQLSAYEGTDQQKIAEEIAKAYPNSQDFAFKIVEVANNLGTNPYWLANLINFETAGTFSPTIVNDLGYTGLIQFGTIGKYAAIKDLGITKEQLLAMTAVEQMDQVEKYYNLPHKRNESDYSDPIDLYMAVFYPPGIGNPDLEFSQNIQDANNGIDTPREYARRANRNAKLPTGM